MDWNWFFCTFYCKLCKSPSLRGSGLKFSDKVIVKKRLASPSLRGSGLKSLLSSQCPLQSIGLPLYEGVDWNRWDIIRINQKRCLPLYEGVDWNCGYAAIRSATFSVSLFTREWIEIADMLRSDQRPFPSPSLRGSGLKWTDTVNLPRQSVSLFTREWIEMNRYCKPAPAVRLPLYEGVDWNMVITSFFLNCSTSPSLRGSGLKSAKDIDFSGKGQSPSLRGSGLK